MTYFSFDYFFEDGEQRISEMTSMYTFEPFVAMFVGFFQSDIQVVVCSFGSQILQTNQHSFIMLISANEFHLDLGL